MAVAKKTISFTSASPSLANYTALPDLGASDRGKAGQQFLRVFANGTDVSQTATLDLVLVNKNAVVANFTAAVAVTTRRTDTAGTGGNYTCTVTWAESGTSMIDLFGSVSGPNNQEPKIGTTTSDQGYVWMLGCTAITGSSTLTVTAVVGSGNEGV